MTKNAPLDSMPLTCYDLKQEPSLLSLLTQEKGPCSTKVAEPFQGKRSSLASYQ